MDSNQKTASIVKEKDSQRSAKRVLQVAATLLLAEQISQMGNANRISINTNQDVDMELLAALMNM